MAGAGYDIGVSASASAQSGASNTAPINVTGGGKGISTTAIIAVAALAVLGIALFFLEKK